MFRPKASELATLSLGSKARVVERLGLKHAECLPSETSNGLNSPFSDPYFERQMRAAETSGSVSRHLRSWRVNRSR